MRWVRLVKKAKKGDKEALLHLVLSEKNAYYRLAYSYMGNANDAMDAMEDMIVKVYENIGKLQDDPAFYSWSKTILANSCKRMLDKQSKLILVDDWQPEHERIDDPATRDPYKTSDGQLDMQSLLLQVNEHQREAIRLKYVHDFDYQTIADVTNVPVGTVKSRIFQGLKKLREYCKGGGIDG
ncbi:sigma-70 family RNA polymerase sigma factor [Paenibacillus pasadenensis]|uniref:sigma-70 family RNA polymerase sigma factor n=1 Tax=Paenibacillus pasadenensis TaxID=217090 RepID=UPI00203B3C69|nr:sigma-70 family RNA polymerase sigma factor [Paenibacillus pasadenensis]MCM3749763.1 sigma-70 family RNA polymerase sigma factor [Paenibacillus pasadenensis]